jgi:uncharacterized oxidoreductase
MSMIEELRFISATLDVLGTDANEILVEAARSLPSNPGPEEHALVNGFNEQMLKLFTASQVSRARPRFDLARLTARDSEENYR